jgi:ribosomal protein L37AE/L43A
MQKSTYVATRSAPTVRPRNQGRPTGRNANSLSQSMEQSFKCESCGQWLMAPERSTYMNEEQITHLWVCPKCGSESETSIFLGQEAPLTPEVVERFLPNLLVA